MDGGDIWDRLAAAREADIYSVQTCITNPENLILANQSARKAGYLSAEALINSTPARICVPIRLRAHADVPLNNVLLFAEEAR